MARLLLNKKKSRLHYRRGGDRSKERKKIHLSLLKKKQSVGGFQFLTVFLAKIKEEKEDVVLLGKFPGLLSKRKESLQKRKGESSVDLFSRLEGNSCCCLVGIAFVGNRATSRFVARFGRPKKRQVRLEIVRGWF